MLVKITLKEPMTINVPNVLYSWKTTLAGVAALALSVLKGYQGGGGFMGAIHDSQVQTLLILGVLGLFSKDFDTTGGQRGQPSSPLALHEANQAPSTTNIPVGPIVPPAVIADKILAVPTEPGPGPLRPPMGQ